MATKKIVNDGLTNKQRILRMVERWDDDIPFERALYHLHVMKEVMEAIQEADAGLGMDHDVFFDELERLCDEEENQRQMDANSAKKPEGATRPHRGERIPKNGEIVRRSPKKIRKQTS